MISYLHQIFLLFNSNHVSNDCGDGLVLPVFLCFGILAVKYKTARRVILPLVNFLESVPLLGFLTFTTAWLLGLFPGNVMGAEAVAILPSSQVKLGTSC